MRKEFDFEEIGKEVPYQVPDAFFEKMQGEVLSRVGEKHNNRFKVLKFVPWVAAVAAAFTVVLFLPIWNSPSSEKSISQATAVDDSWIEQISDEDLEIINDFSECDIFMKEN